MMMMALPATPPRSDLVEDFSDRATGSLVGQGWSLMDGATAVNFTVQADGTSISGRSVLIDKTTSDAMRRITIDRVGAVGSVEVLARIKFTETVNFDNGQVNIRANAAPSGVFFNISGTGFSGTAEDNLKQLWRLTSATTAVLIDSEAFVHAVDTWYWVRLRGSSSTFSAKIWEDGSVEPAFQITGTDASAPATGQVGMGSFESDDNFVFDYFSVALNGATAPFPQG
jgi:hypothetical protein